MGIYKSTTVAALLMMLLSTPSFAEEADEFIRKEDLPKESNADLNQLINRHLTQFRDQFNSRQGIQKCERSEIVASLLYSLDRNFSKTGNALRDIAKGQGTSSLEFKGPTDKPGSVYEGMDRVFCCVKTMNISGTPVGLDKVDHFFGNAGLLFEQWEKRSKKDANDVAHILQLNVNQENGSWGLAVGNVKSYGDLGANWSGFMFYRELLDGPKPYYSCKGGKLILNKEFKIEKYFNKSWSETINCSAFPDKDMAEKFAANLEKKEMSCPLVADDCKEIIELYKDEPNVQQAIISPTCLSGKPLKEAVEESGGWHWTDTKAMLGGIRVQDVKNILFPEKDKSSEATK